MKMIAGFPYQSYTLAHFLVQSQHRIESFGTLEMRSLSKLILILIAFLKLWNITISHSAVLFKKVSSTTDYLVEVTTFTVMSQIQCGLQCLLLLEHNTCAAFAFDMSSSICTCGVKRLLPVQNTSSVANIFVGITCPKLKTGQPYSLGILCKIS